MGKLSDYETPPSVLDGEWFTLSNGLRVKATLPVMYNRKFQFKIMELRAATDDETASTQYDSLLVAFNTACIVEVDDPDAKLPLDLDKYVRLIQEVYELASSRAQVLQKEQDKAAKKSKPI